LSSRETDAQVRYISDLSQIPIEEIKKLRLTTKNANTIIKKLLDKNFKKFTTTQLKNWIENEVQDEQNRMQEEPSNTDSAFTIDE
jgi:hypothetical protein